MGANKHHDHDWLIEQYHEKGRTQSDIAEECGITQASLSEYMNRHNIKARSKSEAVGRALKPDEPYADVDWLRREYVENERTLEDIASEFGVTGQAIIHWMDKHGIERRDQQAAQRPDGPHTDSDWLREKYHDEKLSLAEIGELCDRNPATLLKWFRRFDIPRRSPDYARRTGPVHFDMDHGEFGEFPGGYVKIQARETRDGNTRTKYAYVHQLIAIAEGADPHKVFSGGKYHCHHKNGIRWDNRPSNIEFTTREKHIRDHSNERERTPTGEWV